MCQVARYVKKECEKGNFQCIVISLKLGLYEHADALIGVSRKVHAYVIHIVLSSLCFAAQLLP